MQPRSQSSVVSSNVNGTNVSYTWDAAYQLATVQDNWTGGKSSYGFDKTGQLSSVAYPNGVKHNYTTYDARDRLTNLNVSGGSGALASCKGSASRAARPARRKARGARPATVTLSNAE